MKEQSEFLYSPPPAAFEKKHEKEVREWHKQMSAEYILTERRIDKVLYQWLRKAKVAKQEMANFGIKVEWSSPSLSFCSETDTDLYDHYRVIKRRADGALFILSEPYCSVKKIENSKLIKAWRSIGSEVIISGKSGWMPKLTVMFMIGEPLKLLSKTISSIRMK